MAPPIDRLTTLRSGTNPTKFTGIDFVHVAAPCEQTELHVFFLTDLNQLTPPFAGASKLAKTDITITSATDPNLPPIEVTEIVEHEIPPLPSGNFTQVWSDDDLQRTFLKLRVDEPGDFTRYRIHIRDPLANPTVGAAPFSRIDPYFNDIEMSFKASCERDADCAPIETACPPEPSPDFPIDYLARDFVSLRNALIDFAAQRYPQWAFPLEADVGMMLTEVFAALGDELSYVQDRYAREAFLQTANQRRSLRKKARLLDFEIHDGRSPSTVLDVRAVETFPPGTVHLLAAGTSVWAASEAQAAVPFEIGKGLHDVKSNGSPSDYPILAEWNLGKLVPFVFDAHQVCLDVDATELFVFGAVSNKDLAIGRPMLLRTDPPPGITPRRHVVTVREIVPLFDPLQGTPPGQPISRIRWDEEDALPFQLDQSVLKLSLNLVPATAGETFEAEFVTGAISTTPFGTAEAVEREGPLVLHTSQRSTIFLFGLERTSAQGLGFLGEDLRGTIPEVRVASLTAGDESWTHRRSLVGASPDDLVFTLEDGQYAALRTFRTAGEELVHQDYVSGNGFSLRFGDGEFGRQPSAGTRFRVTYRTGPGRAANVPSGAVTALQIPGKLREAPAFVAAVENPLAVVDGEDPETQTEIKLLAPEAYQADLFFAVRPEDYGEQAQKLDFIQRAQGSQRYTGSWLTTFVAGDVLGSNSLTTEQQTELSAWMDCVRQAGKEVNVRDPSPLSIDLEVKLCVEPFADASQVVTHVHETLLGSGLARGTKGFFHPDNFTFGTPLRRSALEAAILGVSGVRAVRGIQLRLRGVRRFSPFTDPDLTVAADQILRLDNDPLHPENGTLTLLTEGSS
jgi:hypothetical protein